ncbi:hypothetical protein GDO78_003503 [Eleutherodactylus coqui]|uniref:Myb-like domain-containing protein n=1 Tax=Eleutherodactylus coqui TaxID=57060 RepID=A0A8J6JZ39_ELECQ|nr:hypothetical protein GDO78_003503 [Eleutherodactylus coqui]
MKTDLNFLLECLKFQMNNPDSQKETLEAVCCICQDNNDACDYFREIGGLMFLNNLATSSTHSVLKEASFYSLAVIAESNVYCQQTLCTSALFEDVRTNLLDEQSSINLKRMCVFIFLNLVSNNKTGQSLARESGCIDILLLLFRKLLACNVDLTNGNINPQYLLWSSVCSTLCACVNNPQNGKISLYMRSSFPDSSAFPQGIERLQQSLEHEIARPIFSLIGLTVANSRFAQDYFASIGGLDILADVLSRLVKGLDSKLAIAVTKTLDACVTENTKLVHCLSKRNVLSSLMSLLSCETLEAEDKFSIVLTVGHLTEDCEANQYELLRSNGLPLMIQALAESQDDELHKAATFVLQNCRCITEMLSQNLNEHVPNVNPCFALSHNNQKTKSLDEYWRKAVEIFHRIQNLQQEHDEEISSIPVTERSLQCSGCLVTGHVMNSRNCSKILLGCPSLCDRHRVILRAEERYREEYRKLLYGTRDATPQKRRTRKDFTQEEITNLLDGVEKFGHNWNAILWSYPFQKNRRNVDLAKKYKRLKGQH